MVVCVLRLHLESIITNLTDIFTWKCATHQSLSQITLLTADLETQIKAFVKTFQTMSTEAPQVFTLCSLQLCFIFFAWFHKEEQSEEILLCEINKNNHVQYRARWLRGNAQDSHSGGPGFESRCRLTWLGFFVVFLSHQGKCCVGFSLPRAIWPSFIKFIYHNIKLKSVNLTNETLTTQQ